MGRRRAPRQPRNRAEQAPRASHRGADSFDRLPDELVLALASRLGSARALVCLGQTCRRMHSLMADAHLWRPLCIASHSEFEPPEHFVDFGKNWPWVYRAHIPISHDPPAQSGCSVGTLRRSDFVYRGDLCRAGQHADVNRYVDRHGYGHALWEDGSVYDGEWRDDRPHGRGWYVWPGGVRYDGTWKGGEMHGRGAITYTDGHTYAGRWERGVFDGAGVHTLPDGRQKSCRREGTDWYDVADAADGMDHTDAGDGSPSSAQAATPRTHLAVYGTCMPTRRPTILLSCSRLMLNLAVATLFFSHVSPAFAGASAPNSPLSRQGVGLSSGLHAAANPRYDAPTAVARLLAPTMPPPFVQPKSLRFEIFADQRRTRGFHDREIQSLCNVLGRFASRLVDALRCEGERVPAHLEQCASLLLCWTDVDWPACVEDYIGALCALIEQWPAFARWFARFAVPRISAFEETWYGFNGDIWDVGWTDHPGAMADAIARAGRGDHRPGQLDLFRACFYDLFY